MLSPNTGDERIMMEAHAPDASFGGMFLLGPTFFV